MKDRLPQSQLPGDRQAPRPNGAPRQREPQTGGLFDQQPTPPQRPAEQQRLAPSREPFGLDHWTDVVIQNDFDERVIGRVFILILNETRSADIAVAFAAIIAKAKLARERRRRG